MGTASLLCSAKSLTKIEIMSAVLAIFLGLLAVASASSPYKDCGSKAKVTGVDVNGCTQAPCLLPKGTDASMIIKFEAPAASTAVNTVVHGIIAGIPVPFSVPEGKACETGHVNPGCPLTAGAEHAYDIKLPVSSWYPSLRLNVRWQLQDENGAPLVCIIFPAMLK